MSNYRGIREASLVRVLEGNGTPESPFTEVEYVISPRNEDGRLVTLGVVKQITDEEKARWNK